MNNKTKIILPIVFLSTAAFVLFQVKNNINLNSEFTSNPDQNDNSSTDQINTNIDFHELTIISDRCRGCGRCVQIDPAHFEMNGKTAVVISSTNLNSSDLQLAINNCPVQAINLE